MIIIFPLVTNRQHGDRLVILDLKQDHIASTTKRNNQLSQKRIAHFGFAAGKWKFLQYSPGFFNGLKRSLCCGRVVLRHKRVQAFQIGLCFQSELKSKTHFCCCACSKIERSESITSSLDAYSPVNLALSRAASPLAINSQ